jgi:hypothetical protein
MSAAAWKADTRVVALLSVAGGIGFRAGIGFNAELICYPRLNWRSVSFPSRLGGSPSQRALPRHESLSRISDLPAFILIRAINDKQITSATQ